MASANLIYRKGKNLFLVALLTLIITPDILTSQTHDDQHLELSEPALNFYRVGLQSDIYGIKMNLIYYAGKYKISEVSQNLLEVLRTSNNDEISQMAIWSLYQIGEDSLCEELESLLKNHPSEKLRNFCKFLQMIREYETVLAKN
jgi:HEAT repeat protein